MHDEDTNEVSEPATRAFDSIYEFPGYMSFALNNEVYQPLPQASQSTNEVHYPATPVYDSEDGVPHPNQLHKHLTLGSSRAANSSRGHFLTASEFRNPLM